MLVNIIKTKSFSTNGWAFEKDCLHMMGNHTANNNYNHIIYYVYYICQHNYAKKPVVHTGNSVYLMNQSFNF